MLKLTSYDNKRIKQYRKLFPEKIRVLVKKGTQKAYIAEILSFPGAFTEADNFGELIYMVNDCVQTILEIPKKYTSEMPSYSPSIQLAQKFNEFPSLIKNESVEFHIIPQKKVCAL